MLIFILILFQVLIFFVLIFVFRKVMSKNIILATRHLEELNQDYAKKEEALKKRIEEAEKYSQQIIQKAEQEAQRLKAQIIKEAEEQREKILEQARVQSNEIIQHADSSRQMLITEIEERINKEAVNKACLLLEETLPESFKKDVHNRWLDELVKDGLEDLGRLHIPEEIKEIEVVSAFGLTQEQRDMLYKKLKERLGRDLVLREEIEPRIVAGIIINIGSLVLDGSLKNRIKERTKIV